MTAKATLVEVRWNEQQGQYDRVDGGKVIPVHFNPESLKVAYANENRGGNQPSGGGAQYVGNQSSTLTVELLFDTTEPRGDSSDQAPNNDVRAIVQAVSHFIKPVEANQQQSGGNSANRVPSLISFEWGTFLFRGTVESMDETLDYFSEEGVPMRATVNLTIKNQDIRFDFGPRGAASDALAPGNDPLPGSRPLQQARPGESLQQMAGRAGRSGDWKAIAAANGIDDPLRLQAGALINMSAGASLGLAAGAGLSASAGFGASASAGAGFGAGLSAGGQVGFSAGLGAGAGFGAGGSAGAGFGAGGSAGAGFGAGGSAGAGFGAGGSAGAGFGAGGSAGAGFGAGGSAGAGFGAGGSASAAASLLED